MGPPHWCCVLVGGITHGTIPIQVSGTELFPYFDEFLVKMGSKFPYKRKSFNLEVGGLSYGQNKNIGYGENLIESPLKTLLIFFTQIVPH